MFFVSRRCPHCGSRYFYFIPSSRPLGSPFRTCVSCGAAFTDLRFCELALCRPGKYRPRRISFFSMVSFLAGVMLILSGFLLSQYLRTLPADLSPVAVKYESSLQQALDEAQESVESAKRPLADAEAAVQDRQKDFSDVKSEAERFGDDLPRDVATRYARSSLALSVAESDLEDAEKAFSAAESYHLGMQEMYNRAFSTLHQNARYDADQKTDLLLSRFLLIGLLLIFSALWGLIASLRSYASRNEWYRLEYQASARRLSDPSYLTRLISVHYPLHRK